MSRRRSVVLGLGAVAVAASAAGTGYALQRSAARRLRVDEEGLIAAGRSLPGDLQHHFLAVSDGGRIHAVERGSGPAVVLVHGVTLTVATWSPQLHSLAGRHRVIAIDQRGHGQSIAGSDGYSMERLADDLCEVLESLEVTDAVLAGHSMGGMVSQVLALARPKDLARHVRGLALVATSAGPMLPGAAGAPGSPVAAAVIVAMQRNLQRAEQRGRSIFPSEDLGTWLTRLAFGARPSPANVELTRSMTGAMSASAISALLESLLTYDVHRRIHEIDLPTRVVVGTRDLLTPPRMARVMARRIPRAELTTWVGCGHMVMLEREAELNELLHRFSLEVSGKG